MVRGRNNLAAGLRLLLPFGNNGARRNCTSTPHIPSPHAWSGLSATENQKQGVIRRTFSQQERHVRAGRGRPVHGRRGLGTVDDTSTPERPVNVTRMRNN